MTAKLQWSSVKSSLKSSLTFFPPLQLKSLYVRWLDWNFRWFLMFFTLVLTEDGQTEWTENRINLSDINHAHIKEAKPVGTNTQTSSAHHKLSIKLCKKNNYRPLNIVAVECPNKQRHEAPFVTEMDLSEGFILSVLTRRGMMDRL